MSVVPEATGANFPGREDMPGRGGFVGYEAPDELRHLYVGKRVPEKYRKRWAEKHLVGAGGVCRRTRGCN